MDGEIGGDFPENAWTRLLTFPLVALPFQKTSQDTTLMNRNFGKLHGHLCTHNSNKYIFA